MHFKILYKYAYEKSIQLKKYEEYKFGAQHRVDDSLIEKVTYVSSRRAGYNGTEIAFYWLDYEPSTSNWYFSMSYYHDL